MADENKTLYGYITTAINDFDKIYTALYNKKAGVFTAESGETGIHTSEYSARINDYLIRVKGLEVANLEGKIDNMLTAHTGEETGGTASIDIANKTISISTIPAGYYSSAASLKINDPTLFTTIGTDSRFEKNTNSESGDVTYTLTPTQIVSEINLSESKISGDGITITNETAPKVTVSATLETETAGLAITKLGSTESLPENTYAFTIARKADILGKYNINDAITISKGFSDGTISTTNSKSIDISNLSVAAQSERYYINKGTITLKSINVPSATITGEGVLLTETADNGYAINASIGAPTVKAKTTAGYVVGGEEIDVSPSEEQWNGQAETKYLKKGSISSGEVAVVPEFTSSIGKTTLGEGESTDNFITVTSSTADTKITPVIDEGYLKSADTKDLPIKGGTATLYVKKGSATASITEITATPSSTCISNDSTEYEINLNLSAKAGGTITEGYISGSTINIDDRTETQKIYIKKGSVNLAGEFKYEFVDDGDGLATPETSILTTTQPTSGDYYKIVDTHYVNVVNEGYITSGTTASNNIYYIPRATLEYIDSDGEKPAFFQVKQGGFIPSGTIEAGTITGGTLDEAIVSGVLTPSSALVALKDSITTGEEAKYYELNIGKGSTTNAGYISATKGSVSGKYYLGKGKSKVSAAIGTIQKTDAAITKDESGKYSIEVKADATVENTITEGYITANDKEFVGIVDGKLSATGKIELNAAAFELSTEKITTVGLGSSTNLATSSTETPYYIETKLKDSALNIPLTVKATTAGYIGANEEISVNPTLESSKIYIKSGTKLENVSGTGNLKLTSDFSDKTEGDYTVSIAADQAITLSGTLEAGYYAGENLAVSGAASATGSLTVTRGSVSVKDGTAKLTVSSDKINIITEIPAEETAEGYYELSLAASELILTKSVTAGYVKDADVVITPTSISKRNSDRYYIKKFTSELESGENGNYIPSAVNKFGVNAEGSAVNEAIISTKNCYVEKDIKVTLHEDAMGTNVSAALTKLQSRLAGRGVTKVS